MKAIEQYFPLVLLIMLCKMGLTFEFIGEILFVNIQVESGLEVISQGAPCFSVFQKNEF